MLVLNTLGPRGVLNQLGGHTVNRFVRRRPVGSDDRRGDHDGKCQNASGPDHRFAPSKPPEPDHQQRSGESAEGQPHRLQRQCLGSLAFKPLDHGGGDGEKAGQCHASGGQSEGQQEMGFGLQEAEPDVAEQHKHGADAHDSLGPPAAKSRPLSRSQ